MTNRFGHKTRDRLEHMWLLRHTHAHTLYSKDSVVQMDLEAVTADVCQVGGTEECGLGKTGREDVGENDNLMGARVPAARLMLGIYLYRCT